MKYLKKYEAISRPPKIGDYINMDTIWARDTRDLEE